jgi:hypothetical protein
VQPTMYRIRVRGSAFEGMCLEPGAAETRGQPEVYGSTDHPRLTHHPTKGDHAVSRKLRLRRTNVLRRLGGGPPQQRVPVGATRCGSVPKVEVTKGMYRGAHTC